MGKRSNFERRPADFYPTPKAAVLPLIPFLRASRIEGHWQGQPRLVRRRDPATPPT
jgi:hypothetical protein